MERQMWKFELFPLRNAVYANAYLSRLSFPKPAASAREVTTVWHCKIRQFWLLFLFIIIIIIIMLNYKQNFHI